LLEVLVVFVEPLELRRQPPQRLRPIHRDGDYQRGRHSVMGTALDAHASAVGGQPVAHGKIS
jgi:hypothetical protein